ncbi:MAG TPA: HEAT repeat domain-containing protein [Bryobacteraceae bacterium]|jgi:hypothetical protein|nr:HEAT repeat domain-containing protein [Bryobacteraceae bacterium]
MTSEEFRYRIPEYLSGRLMPSERTSFEEQLNQSPELRVEMEELRQTWLGLGLLGDEQPSAALRARFYQRLNDLNSGRSRPLTGGYAWWKPGLAGLVRQITIVLALFCLGMYVGRVSVSGHNSSADSAQLASQVQSLQQTVALSLMDRQSPASRLEGISWSSRVARPDNDLLSALVNTLNHDQNTNVRLASLDALEEFSNDPTVRRALVNSISLQDSPLVQIALIDALVQMRDNTAAGAFRKLTSNSEVNAEVRQRAQWGLHSLSF